MSSIRGTLFPAAGGKQGRVGATEILFPSIAKGGAAVTHALTKALSPDLRKLPEGLSVSLRCFVTIACLISQLVFSETAASDPTAPIGPFSLTGADGSSRLDFRFVSQIIVDYTSEEGVSCGCDGRINTLVMKARRIRPTIGLTLPNQRLFLKLHLSTAPGSIELMDIYFNYKAMDRVQIRAGQFKIPFTRYRIQSFQELTFVDWAIVSPAFGAERQMGFALHNGYEKPPPYSYVFGLFSGQNARSAHAVTLPRRYGLDIGNPSDLADPDPLQDAHPELVVHLAYNARGIDVSSDTDSSRGAARWAIMLSSAWDLDPIYHEDFALRVAPEIIFKIKGFSASAIGYAGWAEVGESRVTRPVMYGGLAQAAYRLNCTYEISGRYAVVDMRNDPFRTEEARAGVNVYLIGHQLKWQTDLGRLAEERSGGETVDYVARSQFQIVI